MVPNNVCSHVRGFVLADPFDEYAAVFKVMEKTSSSGMTPRQALEYSVCVFLADSAPSRPLPRKAEASLIWLMKMIKKATGVFDGIPIEQFKKEMEKVSNRPTRVN